MSKILIRGGTVVTVDPTLGNFRTGDVLIEDTRIAAVGPQLEVTDAEVVDATGMVVMPGFIDTHRHLWEGILRNIGTDVPLEGDTSYLAFVLGTLAPAYRPADIYAGNLVSALGAINAGITTVLDWSHNLTSPEHADAAISALRESGIRSVFAYGFPWHGEWDPEQPAWFTRVANEHFNSDDQLLTLALAPHGPEFTPPEVTKAHWDLAREVGARITVHVGVGSFGKHDKLGEAGRAGLLGPDTTYIHCTTLNDDEVQMIVDTGGTISLAVPVEMLMGHGMVPTQRFLDRGLAPSLSVDVETNVPADMFTQMQSAMALQHALVFDRQLAGEEAVPDAVTTRDVLRWATLEGARANGLEHRTGSLSVGKQADVILLRTDLINVLPVNDPIGAVVMGMDTSNVDSVFVAGQPRKRHGQLLDVDLTRVTALAEASRDHVVSASGFQLPSL
ncbi:amidohydrolase family protein [Natronosporangium hydrolyticum]|uniref:Amidohydrolase family protein n=1 Tax=Natronosporangium hydrolyticum TaxID=2811111 RepID=A0A895YGG5_9ACTN|nr:amidohydrolase family protein [Natronosporangium hydrolyticum]QSB13626.1 amidohydrolase family protein [Natronosporangium hydrolyticum]